MTRRASPHNALTVLKKLDADIVVVPEFGVSGKVDEAVKVAIHSLGYQIIEAPYTDSTLPPHIPNMYEMAVLSRLPLRSHTVHHFDNSGRAFIEAIIELPGAKDTLRLFGVHLDDKAEQLRLEQMSQLVQLINKGHVGETIVMGDFNAMGNRSLMAKLFGTKAAGAIGERLPSQQLKSISSRVTQMAIGTTIQALLDTTELHDLDSGHHLTISAKQAGLEWAPRLRLAKIDWMFGSKNVSTIKYRVSADVGSDHRPVRASIAIR